MGKNVLIEVYTQSELYALSILYGQYSNKSPHKAANEIIELAERIKAERAVAAMTRGKWLVEISSSVSS